MKTPATLNSFAEEQNFISLPNSLMAVLASLPTETTKEYPLFERRAVKATAHSALETPPYRRDGVLGERAEFLPTIDKESYGGKPASG